MSIITEHYTIDWKKLETIPECSVLKNTQQKGEFHGEGDVWTHTQMIIDALIALPAWQQLNEPMKRVVYIAALLHDIGKGVTTRKNEEGEWVSPKHGPVGARIARRVLWKKIVAEVSFTEREMIAALVEYHGMPLWAHDRDTIEYDMRCVSQLVPLQALSILSRADVMGRIAQDTHQLIERITFFDDLAKEIGCYDTAWNFSTDFERWSYATKRHTDMHYTPYDDTWGEVTVLCGVPGSGKDTWITSQKNSVPVVSLDDIREELGVDPSDKNQGAVVQLAFNRAKEFLGQRKSFIWNATNVHKQRRKELIDLFTSYNARVRLVYIEAPYDELWKRNTKREKPVPNQVLQRMIDMLEVPKIFEAPTVEYYIDDSVESVYNSRKAHIRI